MEGAIEGMMVLGAAVVGELVGAAVVFGTAVQVVLGEQAGKICKVVATIWIEPQQFWSA